MEREAREAEEKALAEEEAKAIEEQGKANERWKDSLHRLQHCLASIQRDREEGEDAWTAPLETPPVADVRATPSMDSTAPVLPVAQSDSLDRLGLPTQVVSSTSVVQSILGSGTIGEWDRSPISNHAQPSRAPSPLIPPQTMVRIPLLPSRNATPNTAVVAEHQLDDENREPRVEPPPMPTPPPAPLTQATEFEARFEGPYEVSADDTTSTPEPPKGLIDSQDPDQDRDQDVPVIEPTFPSLRKGQKWAGVCEKPNCPLVAESEGWGANLMFLADRLHPLLFDRTMRLTLTLNGQTSPEWGPHRE